MSTPQRTLHKPELRCWLLAVVLSGVISFSPQERVQFNKLVEAAHPPVDGQPAQRYGHSAAMVDDQLVITHGYYFDKVAHRATWLSDTWAYHQSSNAFHQIHGPTTQTRSDGGPAAGPLARYGAVAVAIGESRLLLHGGEDGGSSMGQVSYVSNIFDDCWELDLTTMRWIKFGAHAPSLAHHGAAVAPNAPGQRHPDVYMFGGLAPTESSDTIDTNNLWVASFSPESTEYNFALVEPSGPQPPARFGSAMTFHGASQMCIFGGSTRALPKNLNDLWCLTLATSEWRELRPAPSARWPGVRAYHGFVSDGTSLFMFGGARCLPGCTTLNDLWTVDTSAMQWKVLVDLSSGFVQGSDQATVFDGDTSVHDGYPRHRYKHTLTLGPADQQDPSLLVLYLFGGEGFRPAAYLNDLWEIRIYRSDPALGAKYYSGLTFLILVSMFVVMCVCARLRFLATKHARE